MKKNGIAFDELRDLLLKLGFSETLERSRMRFDYPTTGTFLLFRLYGPKEIVSEAIDRACVAMKSPSLKYPLGVNLYIF